MRLFNFNLFLLFWDQQAWNSSLQSSCLSLLNAGFSGTCHHAWPMCSFKSCRTVRVQCRHTLDHDSYCDGIEGYRRIFLNVQLQVIPNGKNWQSFQARMNQREKQYWRKRICTVLKRKKVYYKTQKQDLQSRKTPVFNKQTKTPDRQRESRPLGIEDAPHRHRDNTVNCPRRGNQESKIHKSPLAYDKSSYL